MYVDLKSNQTKTGKGLKTIYTCPAGKEAIVSSVIASSLVEYTDYIGVVKNNGTSDEVITNRVGISSGSSVSAVVDKVFLSAGESIKVNSDTNVGKFIINQSLVLNSGESITNFKNLNGALIITTSTGRIFKKNDGDDNFAVLTTTGISGNINDIEYGNGTYVIVSSSSGTQIYTSTNLTTWTASNTGLSVTTFGTVTYGNSLWLITSNTGIHSSTSPTGTFTTVSSSVQNVDNMAYIPTLSLWIATYGTSAGFATAPSTATTWTARTMTNTGITYGIQFDGTRVWFGKSGSNPEYSTDGLSFTPVTSANYGFPSGNLTIPNSDACFIMNGKYYFYVYSTPSYFIEVTNPTSANTTRMSNQPESLRKVFPSDLGALRFAITSGRIFVMAMTSNTLNIGFVDNYSNATFGENTLAYTANIAEVQL